MLLKKLHTTVRNSFEQNSQAAKIRVRVLYAWKITKQLSIGFCKKCYELNASPQIHILTIFGDGAIRRLLRLNEVIGWGPDSIGLLAL